MVFQCLPVEILEKCVILYFSPSILAESFLLLELQQSVDKVFELIAEKSSFPVSIGWSFHTDFFELVPVDLFSWKWGFQNGQLIQINTESPKVNGHVVASFQYHFRGVVKGCAWYRLTYLIFLGFFCQSKICYLHITVVEHQDILWF